MRHAGVTTIFGQATFVWTNSNPADLGSAASWTNAATGANGVPTDNNGVALVLDAPAGSPAGGAQTIASAVNGTGVLQANTYTGNTILNGGVLVANRAENLGVNGPLGNGGFLACTGGTLQFSAVNQYDYSPRFTNSAGQAFSFDTAGQNVTFTNVLASTGGTLTKLGSGSLTLSGANTYDGATTVSAGKLIIQGSQGNGAITVANSAALGVNQGGQTITPASLTVGTSSSATLEFNGVSSPATAAIVTGPVAGGGALTINVNSGSFLIGQSYPLLTFSGTAPAVTLGTLVGAGGNLTTNGSTIKLNITSLAFVWSGLNNANWDISTANNTNSGNVTITAGTLQVGNGGATGAVGSGNMLQHRSGSSMVPDGGNQVFADGSARWCRFQNMFYFTTWNADGSRIALFEQETADLDPRFTPVILNALKAQNFR